LLAPQVKNSEKNRQGASLGAQKDYFLTIDQLYYYPNPEDNDKFWQQQPRAPGFRTWSRRLLFVEGFLIFTKNDRPKKIQ